MLSCFLCRPARDFEDVIDNDDMPDVCCNKLQSSHSGARPSGCDSANETSTPCDSGSQFCNDAPRSVVVESSAVDFWGRKLHREPQVLWPQAQLFTGLSRVRPLKAGGFGCVFKARWCHADVAMKLVVSSPTNRTALAICEDAEARIAENLRHPNIVRTFQTRKAILTREWLDAALLDNLPLGEQLMARQGRSFRSDDGFGAPDEDAVQPQGYLSPRALLSCVNAKPDCCMTVIIMEFASRGSLRPSAFMDFMPGCERSGQQRRKAFRALLRTLREIAQGLAAMHDMGIIHCDLKPQNVLLKASSMDCRGYEAALCDFGLSEVAIAAGGPQAQQSCRGTLLYAAPERLNGLSCKQSDIYSWAVIMYRLCTAHEPFQDIPSGVLFAGIKAGKLRPRWPQGLLPELQSLYERCVQVDPSARPPASEVVRTLIAVEASLRLRLEAHTQAKADAKGPNS